MFDLTRINASTISELPTATPTTPSGHIRGFGQASGTPLPHPLAPGTCKMLGRDVSVKRYFCVASIVKQVEIKLLRITNRFFEVREVRDRAGRIVGIVDPQGFGFACDVPWGFPRSQEGIRCLHGDGTK